METEETQGDLTQEEAEAEPLTAFEELEARVKALEERLARHGVS